MAIFKYLTEEIHAKNMMSKGHILFRTLAYFKALEDDAVRGDPHDGALRYAPEDGLRANMGDGREIDWAGHLLRSSPKANDIFAACMSCELSTEVATAFKAKFCVEISDPEALLHRLQQRATTTSNLDYANALFGRINYRPLGEPPIVDWALPEKLVFIKPEGFSYQAECRFILPKHGALDVHNVDLVIEPIGAVPAPLIPDKSSFVLSLGSLNDFAKLHQF